MTVTGYCAFLRELVKLTAVLKYMKIWSVAILLAFVAEAVGCGVTGANIGVELAHDGETPFSLLSQEDLPDPFKEGGSSRVCNHGCAGHASCHLQAVTQRTNPIYFIALSEPVPAASVVLYLSAVAEPTYRPPRPPFFG